MQKNKYEQENEMIAVGIDVSKGKSTVALLSDTGEVLKKPYDVSHTSLALSDLAKLIRDCKDDICVVMEATGNYHKPIANYLCENGISVSVVNPKLIRDFSDMILSIILDTIFSSFFKSSHHLPLLIVSSAQNQRRKSAVG